MFLKLIILFFLIIIVVCLLNYNQEKFNYTPEEFSDEPFLNFIHIPKNAGMSIKKLKGKKFKYNFHNTNVFNKRIKNQMIILRNPLDRFISSVYYGLQKWKGLKTMKELIKNKIDTPDKWISVWKNPEHPHHSLLMKEIKNKRHRIGKKKLKYKWTYTPQHFWFNKPKYVIILDNLEEEIKQVCDILEIDYKLKKRNYTEKNNVYISEENKKWINEFYKDDWDLYNKYKNIPFDQRINLN